ncbi:MAG: TonB C-terminal domain-containing protein [Elusimicrobia bacterium]|nr:TonB C-terminal domain-containing protein [Elusimicrobiota bacterium]
MLRTTLGRYLTYSTLAHVAILGYLLLASFSQEAQKSYFAVDFVGGLPTGQRGGTHSAPEFRLEKTKQPELEKIHSKEDIRIPSPKKEEVKKEEISAIPSVPIPRPRSRTVKETDSDLIPGIPRVGSGSNIGIGFGEGDSVGGIGAGNFPYGWYVHAVRKKMDSFWNVSSGMGRRIVVQVAFTILKDGSVEGLSVEESSGDSVFDRAALRAVDDSSPFPPLPQDYPNPELRVHVQFTIK